MAEFDLLDFATPSLTKSGFSYFSHEAWNFPLRPECMYCNTMIYDFAPPDLLQPFV